MPVDRAALERLSALPCLPIAFEPTPVEELFRLKAEATGTENGSFRLQAEAPKIGSFHLQAEASENSSFRLQAEAPENSSFRLQAEDVRLLVKRDDAIPFGFGGNKVRKLQIVGAQAIAAGADTLITTGGLQSNHARATAAVAARMGLGCVLIANGAPQDKPTANALLDRLLGAEIRYVPSREARVPAMEQAASELRARGRKPFVIPLGASTPHGAAAYAAAVGEVLTQIAPPDHIVVSTSSGGTQAGIAAGCALRNLPTRVLGISADDPAPAITGEIRRILGGMEELLGMATGALGEVPIEIDDTFVGGGYGVPTPASIEATELCARREALFLDPTYTAKAMAGLIARLRARELRGTVLFWHTGGQVGLFA